METAIIFLASVVASAYGTLVGGGSFLMVPVLIFLGIPAHMAIATNRAGFMGLFFTSIYKFHKKKLINWKLGWTIALPALVGSYLGANFLFQVDEELIKKIFGAMALIILFFIMFKKNVGLVQRKRKTYIYEYVLGVIAAFCAGFLGSMIGGVGVYLSYLLLIFFGQTFLESAGTRKVAGLMIALMAIAVFVYNNAIDYRVAAIMFAGTWIGAWIGVHYSEVIGNVWLKRGFIVVVGIMCLKLIF